MSFKQEGPYSILILVVTFEMFWFIKVLSPLCKQVHIAQQHADGNNFFVKVPRGVLLESSLNVGKIDFLQTIIEICIQHEFDIRMYQNSRYVHNCAILFSVDNCSNIHKGMIKLQYTYTQVVEIRVVQDGVLESAPCNCLFVFRLSPEFSICHI